LLQFAFKLMRQTLRIRRIEQRANDSHRLGSGCHHVVKIGFIDTADGHERDGQSRVIQTNQPGLYSGLVGVAQIGPQLT